MDERFTLSSITSSFPGDLRPSISESNCMSVKNTQRTREKKKARPVHSSTTFCFVLFFEGFLRHLRRSFRCARVQCTTIYSFQLGTKMGHCCRGRHSSVDSLISIRSGQTSLREFCLICHNSSTKKKQKKSYPLIFFVLFFFQKKNDDDAGRVFLWRIFFLACCSSTFEWEEILLNR
jgi:hypothetical protein